MIKSYIPTGNQMVSLPRIIKETAEIQDMTFLHMGYKSLVEICGDAEKPLIKPSIKVNGQSVSLKNLTFSKLENWIPQFKGETDKLALNIKILTPVYERGFLIHFELKNKSSEKITVNSGVEGRWAASLHCVNEDKEIEGNKHCYISSWGGPLVFDMRVGTPMLAFAAMTKEANKTEFKEHDGNIDYSIEEEFELKTGETKEFSIFWGLGFEEVAAVTSAKEMLRRGFQYEFDKTVSYIKKRTLPKGTFKDSKLTELYNDNLLFCLFYSSGITLDTEELVMVTSRSPRYYVSAAYWDRDSLLWSFPSILDCDEELAREILTYVFTRQARNFGVHSRYIDGTVLEPGFELDELMAPIIALENYINVTNDSEFSAEPFVKAGVRHIIKELATHKDDKKDLYETFLQPTDDEHVYKYITYDNALVYKALMALGRLYPEYSNLKEKAQAVKTAIYENCVKEKDGLPFFAWSVDLSGNYDIYDEPAGSLQQLASLGFCDKDDEVYKNTVNIIRSPDYKYSFAESPFAEIGCPHAPHPWILSVGVSLLCNRVESCSHFLHNVVMDNGIACESVDENTGVCTTGAAFATCAGFLCHALKTSKERLNEIYEK